jgi:serine protease AprX
VLLLAILPSPGFAAGDRPRVHPDLLHQAQAHPDQTFRVIVGRRGGDRSADTAVAAKGDAKLAEVDGVGLVAEVKGKDLGDLGSNPAVQWIAPDAPMAPTTTVSSANLGTIYNQTLDAKSLWAKGLTGAGIGVAVVDTGVNSSLPDFGNRVVASVDFNNTKAIFGDGMGHGTLVAGIIGGNSWNRGGAVAGKYVGVAPGANLINLRVADDQGMAYESDVINALNWAVSNRQKYNIRVINLSLVSGTAESYRTSYLDAAVERAWFNGIVVVVAAGNAGHNTELYPPANDPFVVTVGADDPMGTTARSDDGLAPWTSYGITQDGFAKPDVVAPGRHIVGPLAGMPATLASKFPSRIVDQNYIWMSGTSLAAPMVAGLAALAFQAHPTWTNDAVKWLLMNTATRLGTTDASGSFVPCAGQGSGLVDAAAVVSYAGTPGVANNGIPISEQLIGPNGATSYTTSSWSTSSWSTSSWSTSSWSTSSWSTSTWSTTTPEISPWAFIGVE